MKYYYTAVFDKTDDGTELYCKVPDLPGCVTTADDFDEAIDLITDAASGWLVVAEDEGNPIPESTPQSKLYVPKDACCSIVCIDTNAYRAATDTRSVRKNVSLPAWMATLADRRGLNCSKVLQNALMQLL